MKLIIIYLKKRLLNCRIINLEAVLKRYCDICTYVVVQKLPEHALINVFLEGELLGSLVIEFKNGVVTDIHE